MEDDYQNNQYGTDYYSSVNENDHIWLDGVTATPNGNRATTYDDWKKSNELEQAASTHGNRVRRSTRPIRNFINKVSLWGLKGLGKIGDFFNNLFTSGAETDFGQTSPFSDIDRQEIQRSRRRFGRKARHKIEEYSPFLSPTSYLAAWQNGSLDPRIGAKAISQYQPSTQLMLYGLDMFLLGRNKNIPKDIRNNVHRLMDPLVEELRFPSEKRTPYHGNQELTMLRNVEKEANLWYNWPIKKFKYKYSHDPIDRLILEDVVSKLKQYVDNGSISKEAYARGSKKIMELQDKDYNVVEFDENYAPPGGYHCLGTDIVSDKSNASVGTHEGIMHGSEDPIWWDPNEHLFDPNTPTSPQVPYQNFVDKLNLPSHTAQARGWHEARASIGELKRHLLKRTLKKLPKQYYHIDQVRPYFIDYLNKMSDKKLRRLFKKKGGYAKFYDEYYNNNPNYIQDLRDLLINGL